MPEQPTKYITVEIEKTIQQTQFEPLKLKVGVTYSTSFKDGDELQEQIDELHGTLHDQIKKLFRKHGIKKRFVEDI